MTVVKHDLDNQGILTIKLNRPEKLNALNDEVLANLREIFIQAQADSATKVLVITGTQKAFCAGADIKRLASCDSLTGFDFAKNGQETFNLLENLGKPSIAAINGYAFGGGLELALAATLRIACTSAKLGQPEIKLGIIPGYGGTQRLARAIGKSRAIDLCLTGRSIDAKTALDWGIVSMISDELELATNKLAKSLLGLAPLAAQAIIDVINHGFDLSLNDALHLEALHFAKLCASADKQEGVSAFLEKRPAKFRGV